MSIGEINGHDFEPDPCGQSVCKHCGLLGWSSATTCVAGLPRCESCKKPKAQSSADADSGRFCCKGFGTSESCAPYGSAPQREPGGWPSSVSLPTSKTVGFCVPSAAYTEPLIPQRDIDAELGAVVRKSLDTLTATELYRLQRKLGTENPRLAPALNNIFAAYRAAKGKMNT